MSLETFRMSCPTHGVFTGQGAVDHIAECMGRKPGQIWYGSTYSYKKWRPCDQVVKARPWVAPKAPQEVPQAFLDKMASAPDVTHEYVTERDEVAA